MSRTCPKWPLSLARTEASGRFSVFAGDRYKAGAQVAIAVTPMPEDYATARRFLDAD